MYVIVKRQLIFFSNNSKLHPLLSELSHKDLSSFSESDFLMLKAFISIVNIAITIDKIGVNLGDHSFLFSNNEKHIDYNHSDGPLCDSFIEFSSMHDFYIDRLLKAERTFIDNWKKYILDRNDFNPVTNSLITS